MRKLLGMIEQLGATTVSLVTLRDLGESDAAIAGARAVGIVRDASPATTFACPGVGCARDVRRGKKRLLAVCVRDPSECETVAVTPEDLAEIALSIDALAATLQRLLAITPARVSKRAPTSSIVLEPTLLGEQSIDGAARDAFLVIRPAHTALAAFLSARERAPRATLVLVPTPDAIDHDLATRYAPGSHVELAVVSDLLTIRDGAIVATTRLRIVRSTSTSTSTPTSTSTLRARLPPYAAWPDLHLRLADGLTLLVTIGRASARVSYIDLGLAHGTTRDPLLGWRVLVAICEGHGKWDWTKFGDKDTVPQLVSELQRKLMAAFDLRDKPFDRMTRAHGYKPKFRASPGPGGKTAEDRTKDEGGWS